MSIIVKKFGGTSVGDVDRIKRVAKEGKADGKGRSQGSGGCLGEIRRHQ